MEGLNFATYSKFIFICYPIHTGQLTYLLTNPSYLPQYILSRLLKQQKKLTKKHTTKNLQVKRIEKKHKIFPCNRTNKNGYQLNLMVKRKKVGKTITFNDKNYMVDYIVVFPTGMKGFISHNYLNTDRKQNGGKCHLTLNTTELLLLCYHRANHL